VPVRSASRAFMAITISWLIRVSSAPASVMNTSFLDGRFKCNAPACNIENNAAEAILFPASNLARSKPAAANLSGKPFEQQLRRVLLTATFCPETHLYNRGYCSHEIENDND